MLANWWKCQIVGDDKSQNQFHRGDIVFAKNGDNFITLFDGRKRVRLPKSATRNIKLLARLDRQESSSVEQRYQFMRTPEPSPSWDPRDVWG